MPCSPRMRSCYAGCLHRQMVREYQDAVDAWEALRETYEYMNWEDEDYEREFPRPLFKNWLIAKGGERDMALREVE